MTRRFLDIAFTPAVQAAQTQYGSRSQYARMRPHDAPDDLLGPDETAYLESADSFYLATVNSEGWPYVQHRGGPAGFLKVVSPARLAFADFRGNLQYISAGNTADNDRACLFVMDYAQRQRLKLLGRLHFVPLAAAEPEMLARVALPGYPAKVERVALFDVVAFDWNCPQHIVQRFTRAELDAVVEPLRRRIAELETALATVRRAMSPDTPDDRNGP